MYKYITSDIDITVLCIDGEDKHPKLNKTRIA
jgi:hypothetical protein